MIVGLEIPDHPAYSATAIGGEGLVDSCMNNSGFWIFSKLSGLTETETLRSRTPLVALWGITAFPVPRLLATVLPLAA